MQSITVVGVRKNFGEVEALRGLDLAVQKGTILGLLGPNGAGKTTLIRALATLLLPDEGSLYVEGHDVVKEPDAVRRLIGLTGQYAAVDEQLTGRENLVMVGRLYHMDIDSARVRAQELLEKFDLADAADRTLKTYSGGTRRRIDLAASLVNRPPVLFLDEPTIGLDPLSRRGLWGIIRELVTDGTTVLLTTQYLEEADYLSNNIVVIDRGVVIAKGTPQELKTRAGGDVLEVRLSRPEQAIQAQAALAPLGDASITAPGVLVLPLPGNGKALPHAIRALDGAKVGIEEFELRHPTLDEAFLHLTNRIV